MNTEMEQYLAKAAISEVIDRFSSLEIDVPAQAQLFTEDVVINVYAGGQQTMAISSRAQMIELFSQFTAPVKKAYHMNGQQVIDLNADGSATDTHYCEALLVSEDENGQEVTTKNYIRYVDTLVQVDGQWLISRREQTFVLVETK